MALSASLILGLELAPTWAGEQTKKEPNTEVRLAPGDDKTSYENTDYETNSLSLEYRTGKAAGLYEIATSPQLGLPLVSISTNNRVDRAKIQLGRKLFFDRRLSRNKTMSCAMCHIPEQGFSNNELQRAIGFEGRNLKRNAPTILNVAYYQGLFADARESNLEQQVWSPLLAPNEMNNPSIGYVIDTIVSSSDYSGLFENAFGTPVSMQNIGDALAQYQRSLISGNSRFDQWFYGKKESALNTQEIEGFNLFVGKAKCAACHQIGRDYALFTDNKLHNTGIGYENSMLKPSQYVSVQIAPGVVTQVARSRVDSVGIPPENDLGRYEISLDPKDRWKFRTSSLRNIALTAPYMHNGQFSELEEVIEFYNRGGVEHELLSPLITPLILSKDEVKALSAFLRSLTGNNVEMLVSDAFAVTIGDSD